MTLMNGDSLCATLREIQYFGTNLELWEGPVWPMVRDYLVSNQGWGRTRSLIVSESREYFNE